MIDPSKEAEAVIDSLIDHLSDLMDSLKAEIRTKLKETKASLRMRIEKFLVERE